MDYISLLQSEMRPAFGCTEPIALAYAAAKAVSVLDEFPNHIHARCSANIIKNVKSINDINKLKTIYTITKLAVEKEKEGY